MPSVVKDYYRQDYPCWTGLYRGADKEVPNFGAEKQPEPEEECAYEAGKQNGNGRECVHSAGGHGQDGSVGGRPPDWE